MKILIVNRALGTLFGGGESFDINAARYLSERGHQVTVLTGKPLWGQPANQFPDVNVTYLRTPALRRYAYATQNWSSKLSAAFYHLDNLLFEMSAYRWINRQTADKPDVVQCCSLFNLPAWLVQKGSHAAVAWLPGPPSGLIRKRLLTLIRDPHFGLYTHGSPEWSLKKMGLHLQRDFQTIGPGVELQRIRQTPSARCALRERLQIPQDALVGITTARLIPIKNHTLLFRAIERAKQRGTEWHWLIVGNGPLQTALEQEVSKIGIANQVHFLGYQTQEDVHRCLTAADLFGLSSHYENFSIATLEAMGHSLACFGTDVGYLRHLIQDSGAGIVTPANDATSMADMLVAMANPERRREYGKCGRDFVRALDWPSVANDLESLFTDVIRGRRT